MIRLFKPGDRVQLKIGGPVMEVMRYVAVDNEVSSTRVECSWYDPDEGRKTKVFHQNSLFKTNWSKTYPFSKVPDKSTAGGRDTSTTTGTSGNLMINFDEEKTNATSDDLLNTVTFLRKQGFSNEFIAVEGGLKEINTQKVYKAKELIILKAFRFEGNSDVDDMSVLYAIQANDGVKGWIADAYGTYANPHLCEVLNVNKFSGI